jgi:hypothetical protein
MVGMVFPLVGQLSHGRTAFVRRQPVRIVGGRIQGGYTGVFELICPDCGDTVQFLASSWSLLSESNRIALMTPAALELSGDPVHALRLDPCGPTHDVTAHAIRLPAALPFTRSTVSFAVRASCTRGTGYRIYDTRCAGTIQS